MKVNAIFGIVKQKTNNKMKNSNLHATINLRAQMLKALTIEQINRYGKDSEAVNSKYFKSNIGKMVNSLLLVRRKEVIFLLNQQS